MKAAPPKPTGTPASTPDALKALKTMTGRVVQRRAFETGSRFHLFLKNAIGIYCLIDAKAGGFNDYQFGHQLAR